MKLNKTIIAILLIAVLSVVGILLIEHFNDDTSYYTEISYSELMKKIEKKESFGLVIKKDECQYCELYEPKIQKVVNTNKIKNIYYLNITKLTSDENGVFNSLISFTGTPTTVFFEDGVELPTYTRIDGNVTPSKIKQKLTSLKYIK